MTTEEDRENWGERLNEAEEKGAMMVHESMLLFHASRLGLVYSIELLEEKLSVQQLAKYD